MAKGAFGHGFGRFSQCCNCIDEEKGSGLQQEWLVITLCEAPGSGEGHYGDVSIAGAVL